MKYMYYQIKNVKCDPNYIKFDVLIKNNLNIKKYSHKDKFKISIKKFIWENIYILYRNT